MPETNTENSLGRALGPGSNTSKAAFILERMRKRCRFRSVASFPICVFIQQPRQRSKKKIAFAFAFTAVEMDPNWTIIIIIKLEL